MLLTVLGVVANFGLPTGVYAQQGSTETVTVQVNVTLPNGTTVIGTVVGNRTCGTPIMTDWTFKGRLAGCAE